MSTRPPRPRPAEIPPEIDARRPDPDRIRSQALAGVWRASAVYAVCLGLLTVGAPRLTEGDPRSALLPGVPGAIVALLHVIGRRHGARRLAMALATATAGFLALTTCASLGALGRISGEGGSAVLFQVSCFALSGLFLAVTVPAWRRVNHDGDRADALLRMYDEL
ncbi:MAG: hypothetical protein AAGI22_08180 [Planctomycetota bacterium]